MDLNTVKAKFMEGHVAGALVATHHGGRALGHAKESVKKLTGGHPIKAAGHVAGAVGHGAVAALGAGLAAGGAMHATDAIIGRKHKR